MISLLLLIGPLLPGSFTKEDVLATSGGSAVLLIAAWCPAKSWQVARFLATSIVATFVAFAGIVGLQAPNATTSWLFGAGLAGLGRYWIDHLIRLEERTAADHTANVLRQILANSELHSRRPRQLPIGTIAVASACLLLGRASKRRR